MIIKSRLSLTPRRHESPTSNQPVCRFDHDHRNVHRQMDEDWAALHARLRRTLLLLLLLLHATIPTLFFLQHLVLYSFGSASWSASYSIVFFLASTHCAGTIIRGTSVSDLDKLLHTHMTLQVAVDTAIFSFFDETILQPLAWSYSAASSGRDTQDLLFFPLLSLMGSRLMYTEMCVALRFIAVLCCCCPPMRERNDEVGTAERVDRRGRKIRRKISKQPPFHPVQMLRNPGLHPEHLRSRLWSSGPAASCDGAFLQLHSSLQLACICMNEKFQTVGVIRLMATCKQSSTSGNFFEARLGCQCLDRVLGTRYWFCRRRYVKGTRHWGIRNLSY